MVAPRRRVGLEMYVVNNLFVRLLVIVETRHALSLLYGRGKMFFVFAFFYIVPA